MTDQSNHIEFANGLRQIADFLEAHPEVKLPESNLRCYALFGKEDAATVARAFGHAEKEYSDNTFTLSRKFGPLSLEYLGMRSSICDRVQVGTEEVPEHFEPAVEAQPERFVEAHSEPIYEWRCAPILADEPELEPVLVPEKVVESDGIPF